MRQFVIASNNENKIREIREVAHSLGINVYSLKDVGIFTDIIEDNDTFTGNALKKAKTIFDQIHMPVLADDSGLCVDYLNGRPGVYSHRYAGDDYVKGMKKLLNELKGTTFYQRTAHYHCSMVLMTHQKTIVVEKKCFGHIIQTPRGNNGFAYDPIFYFPSLKKTMAELTDKEKIHITHRAKATKEICKIIHSQEWD